VQLLYLFLNLILEVSFCYNNFRELITLSSFGSRFKNLRLEKNLTQQQLADMFFMKKSSISRYENNLQIPEIDSLLKFADFFGVSVDYLLCRTDVKSYDMLCSEFQPKKAAVRAEMTYEKLVQRAAEARKYSYSPYSKFKVGAALLTADNELYTGVNIENASYGLTVCAERVALFKAVSEGAGKFRALAVACDTNSFDDAYPCGACRQVIAEFIDDEADIVISINTGEYRVHKLKELLPHAFRL